ncbi:unnamed protein product [Arabidopsis thaliana]|uniref:(thale cress) hypothetical protein n=1 Tax=Arabidopsis thaliana TaxID=3702 RepID=A0A7G2EC40_ARATH|nr:unnamed protein product [Arabidopsis thaliana]
MRNAELIFIPTPTVGHLVPFLEFARRLIEQDDRIRITFLLMKQQGQSHLDSYVKTISSSLPFVRFIDVPELEEKPTLGTQSVEAYVYDFIERNVPLVQNIIMGILSSPAFDGVTVKGFVADFFCLPMIDVAKDASLPFYVFLTSNSGFLAMMQYLAYGHKKDTSVFARNSEEMLSIPGFVNPVPAKVLPSALFIEDGYDADVKLAILFTKANGILAVGPIFNPKAHPHPDQDLVCCDESMKWLDAQPEASVVFLCFGSMGSLRGPLVKEIAHGLELCQYRFLWSLRTEEELKLAVELKLDYSVHSGEIVSANEIETAISCVMNKDNNVVRKRVMDISQMIQRATKNGGSSFAAIEKFIHDVIGTRT